MPYTTIRNMSMYYQEYNQNLKPTIMFLHGNTASSNMFLPLLPYYEGFHIIMPDFLGNGRSQRLSTFPVDFWYDQGLQTIEFIEQLQLSDIILTGTSGGAMAAMNAVLERPDLFRCVIADSFEGEKMKPDLFVNFEKEREASLRDPFTASFYEFMNGKDYVDIVHQDTEMIMKHIRFDLRCIHKRIDELEKPVLLLGSDQDDMIPDIRECYEDMMHRSNMISMHVFCEGTHPSISTNDEASADRILTFIKNN